MKRVLITGENSYIGTSVEQWLKKDSELFEVTVVSVRGNDWRSQNWKEYDCIFHVAGIAHADTGKITEEEKARYYQINRDLSFDVAEKFKADRQGKKSQFIYMSSIIVYDDKTNVSKQRVITSQTKPNPSSFYGDSKLQAELKLSELEDDGFTLAVVRPPMIYGKGSKGNYSMLSRLALKTPVFPKFDNERSMLHISNLSEFIRLLIMEEISGIFFPQNKEYIKTSDLVKIVADTHNHKLILTPLFNWGIILLSLIPGKVGKLTNKAFGNLVYDKKISTEKIDNYQIIDFEESIKLTEES
ncbi:sugar nucleotide-binding protein [Vagococcus sp. BWB3-3]|uniref:Sugar nucleotide-binding protein n=1 Tax=Vagococcus allomyrinae TaxID=2794353 RepID=A0A940PCP0_9ENTE|nr:NAD-dependent epimerase/dehydratase family protein [Vagococcus allomyrinae]MBP1043651.1 sugar nucleotide-binding protein [Vagococcus allomyrinae]